MTSCDVIAHFVFVRVLTLQNVDHQAERRPVSDFFKHLPSLTLPLSKSIQHR